MFFHPNNRLFHDWVQASKPNDESTKSLPEIVVSSTELVMVLSSPTRAKPLVLE